MLTGDAMRTASVAPTAAGKPPIRAVFVITELGTGGGEQMLVNLLSRIDRSAFEPTVVSLHAIDGNMQLAARLRELDVAVHTLNWQTPAQAPRALAQLRRLIGSLQPDVVQGWMIHANAAVHLATVMSRREVPVVWSVHHSVRGLTSEKAAVRVLVRALRFVSSSPARVIYVSRTSAQEHEQLGYDASRTCVIPNGFDCDQFRPRPECREQLRSALGLPHSTPLVGLIARVHPAKDHDNFLRAARRLTSLGSNAHFVLAGLGTDTDAMARRVSEAGLTGRVHGLGKRTDVPQVMAAMDIASSSSVTEGFPLAIGEAMACGVPCVATDLGDCAFVIGDTGRIVPPRNPVALSNAWMELLSLDPESRHALGRAARSRIVENFSIATAVASYERLYSEIVYGSLRPVR